MLKDGMLTKLKNSPLFTSMSEEDIENCLTYSGGNVVAYKQGEIVFHQADTPDKLMVLVAGSVVICSDSIEGKRSITARFDQAGELFGEVFVFLNKDHYDYYAQAASDALVLQIPKAFFYQLGGEDRVRQNRLISNMLSILAQKAYFLNRKVQILSCATLRQKIAKVLLQNAGEDGKVELTLNREELADFLNTARPSLSRELMNMQEDGLIMIKKREIYITNFAALEEIL
ncbi:MAG: Crp/Fnr family transcriptional regulator [Lachnospiraceae bacterium]